MHMLCKRKKNKNFFMHILCYRKKNKNVCMHILSYRKKLKKTICTYYVTGSEIKYFDVHVM